MRYLLIGLMLAMASCGAPKQADKPHATTGILTFDGADATDPAGRVAHGERLTHVLGCTGCHDKGLTGDRFYELYASNLTRDIPKYSDAQLERLLRHGERIDHRDLWSMPSEIFQHLSDRDLAALTAYLRTLRPEGKPTEPPLPFEKDARELIAKGEIKPAAASVAEAKATTPLDLGPSHALGRYITMVTCAECHGPKLEGHPGDTPNLIVAGGYSRAEFEKLITQGIPTGNRKLNPMMSGVAKTRFAHLTPHERGALYAYLKARAEQPQ